jgi:hypothetical protein
MTDVEHYRGGDTYEAIKVIEAWGLNFNLGNALKYIARAGKKDSETRERDLGKAISYITREITSKWPWEEEIEVGYKVEAGPCSSCGILFHDCGKRITFCCNKCSHDTIKSSMGESHD